LYVSIAQSPSAESKFQRHDAAGDAKEDCRAIGIVMQGVGEVISTETRAMGLKRKASEREKQPPRSGLVQQGIIETNKCSIYYLPGQYSKKI
jgi:hypothetical protein